MVIQWVQARAKTRTLISSFIAQCSSTAVSSIPIPLSCRNVSTTQSSLPLTIGRVSKNAAKQWTPLWCEGNKDRVSYREGGRGVRRSSRYDSRCTPEGQDGAGPVSCWRVWEGREKQLMGALQTPPRGVRFTMSAVNSGELSPWLTLPALRCPILVTVLCEVLPLSSWVSGDTGIISDPLQLFAQLLVLS